MLILPLHRPLSRANFPFLTVALIAFNVFVFFVLQGGDDAAMRAAQRQYVESGLAALELPAYERHLQGQGRNRELDSLHEVPEEKRARRVAMLTDTDVAFLDAMHSGAAFGSEADFAAWKPLRAQYDTVQSKVFTLRHLQRSSEIDPWRMLAAAFLHSDIEHLIGNMIFLAVLGPLLEGALGVWCFGALYLLGAFGSSAASLLWRWGETGGGLGASGAIAALMGAFCVVWGWQPVRFFYWFGVVFDYVKKPAIWLLPLWLGWEVYHLLFHSELNIGFDAHAGGIISGALLGLALVHMGQVRQDYIRDVEDDDATQDDRLERAQKHLGRMELAEADALLAQLQHEQPQRFDLALARWRVAANGGSVLRGERALTLLALPAPDVAAANVQLDALKGLPAAEVPDALRLTLARRWLQLECFDGLDAVLAHAGDGAASGEWAALHFAYGLRLRAKGEEARFRDAMQGIVQRHPGQPQAAKARFLLEN